MDDHTEGLVGQGVRKAKPDATSVLAGGLDSLLPQLHRLPELHRTRALADLEGVRSFLETFVLVRDTMSQEQVREALRNAANSIQKAFDHLPRTLVAGLPSIKAEKFSGKLDFVCHALRLLGPDIRIAPNEMAAWIRIDPEEGAAALFTVDSIVASLKERGVVFGIDEEKIRQALKPGSFGKEVCVARGQSPQQGRDGRIEYKVRVNELGQTPKILSDGKVSFKDINLFAFVSAGDTLMVRIPPTTGSPGHTVTGRTIQPLPTKEAQFPRCDNTRISPDGNSLLATIDGCVTKRGGRIILEPALRVSGDVSYATGNIDSRVSVLVGGDVLPGFVVRSDQDIYVSRVVEAAQLESKGNITVKGGIEGKGKATLEANGDIAAKFISDATVISLRNVIVESGIVQSRIWAGEKVIVSGVSAEIVGGVVEADGDVVADIIGSELGVETIIRLGGRQARLAQLVKEVQDKIAVQEEAVEQCNRILDGLRRRLAEGGESVSDLREAHARAERMMQDARDNLEKLRAEYVDLESQYEETLARPRSVRARKNTMPGTLVDIQGVELKIMQQTGPATVLRYGDELRVFPFKELEDQKIE